jgi:hypothetical protein
VITSPEADIRGLLNADAIASCVESGAPSPVDVEIGATIVGAQIARLRIYGSVDVSVVSCVEHALGVVDQPIPEDATPTFAYFQVVISVDGVAPARPAPPDLASDVKAMCRAHGTPDQLQHWFESHLRHPEVWRYMRDGNLNALLADAGLTGC